MEKLTVVTVPETTVDEHRSPISRECDIGVARHVAGVKPITETLGMQRFANRQFRLGALATDAGHHPASRRAVYNVNQRRSARFCFFPASFSVALRMCGAIWLATAFTAGTATELPNCLYAWVSETRDPKVAPAGAVKAHKTRALARRKTAGRTIRLTN